MNSKQIPAMDLHVGSVVTDRGRVTLHRIQGAPARVIVRYEGEPTTVTYAPTDELATEDTTGPNH